MSPVIEIGEIRRGAAAYLGSCKCCCPRHFALVGGSVGGAQENSGRISRLRPPARGCRSPHYRRAKRPPNVPLSSWSCHHGRARSLARRLSCRRASRSVCRRSCSHTVLARAAGRRLGLSRRRPGAEILAAGLRRPNSLPLACCPWCSERSGSVRGSALRVHTAAAAHRRGPAAAHFDP